MSTHDKDGPLSDGGGKAGEEEGEDMFDISTPPVFTEMLLRMIEELSDEVVSWSVAGDSFIIKQLPAFEAFLPLYYGHGKFSSFARQLNYYGFRRAKRTPSQRLSSAGGGGQGAAAAAEATTRGFTWDEFRHPMFRRGRRDLLAGISRHKNGARLKSGEVASRELDMLNSLRADVGALSSDLETANGKLRSIMSLLADVAGGQNHSFPKNTNHEADVGGGGGGGSRFPGGNIGGSAAAPAEVDPGGSDGFGGWICGGGTSDGGIRGGVDEWGVSGAPPGYFVGPSVLIGHQQPASGHYPVCPPPSQNPLSTQRYPIGPHQVLCGEALPSRTGALTARASESAYTGRSLQQCPPHHQPT